MIASALRKHSKICDDALIYDTKIGTFEKLPGFELRSSIHFE